MIKKIINIIINIIILLLVGAINLYKLILSPLLPSSCRFYPSCSTYAIIALKKYGLFKGLFLSVKRILRCQPFCQGGYDMP